MVARPVGVDDAGAQSISDLNSQITSAQSQAQSLAADVDAKAAQVAAAHQQAVAAAAARGPALRACSRRASSAPPARDAGRADAGPPRARPARSCAGAEDARRRASWPIYQGDAPDVTELLLSAKGFDDLANRAELVGRIEDADASLAAQVRKLRNEVAVELAQVREAKAAAGRVQPAGRHGARPDRLGAGQRRGAGRPARAGASAEAAAASSLRSQVSGWEQQVTQLQQAQAQESQQAAAASGSADRLELGRQLGDPAGDRDVRVRRKLQCRQLRRPGPAAPTRSCPRPGSLYGGSGAPQDASPQEQSRIAVADLGGLRARRLGLRSVGARVEAATPPPRKAAPPTSCAMRMARFEVA